MGNVYYNMVSTATIIRSWWYWIPFIDEDENEDFEYREEDLSWLFI
jgi:hypothetical protein